MNTIDLFTLNPARGFKILGAIAGSEAGSSVSAGDINGDGINDIIVGAPSASHNDRTNAGAVYVIYGKPGGLADIDLLNLTTAQGFKILGAKNDVRAGHSISNAGDINGDGFNDLIIGTYIPYQNSIKRSAETAYVIYGKSGGLTDIDLLSLTAAQGFKIIAKSNTDSAVQIVSRAGDVNGDGKDDIIVSFSSGDQSNDKNGIYVVYGKSGGLANVDLDSFSVAQGFRITRDKNVRYSYQLDYLSTAGDINGDGVSDIIVGGRDNIIGPYVIYGKLGGLTDINLIDLTLEQGFKIITEVLYSSGATSGATSGTRVTSVSSIGDINGDGIDDIVVVTNVAYVIYGKSGRFSDINLLTLTPLQGFRIFGACELQGLRIFGTCAPASNAGDVNGDGISDILVGLHVVYGKLGGLDDMDLMRLTPAQGFKILGTAYDNAGKSVSSAGDINGDGLDDVIIGAPGATHNSRGYAGAVYVVYGAKPSIETIGENITNPSFADTLACDSNNTVLEDRARDNILVDNSSDDPVTKSQSNDSFMISISAGTITITDFNDQEDLSIARLAQIMSAAASKENNCEITLGQKKIILSNVARSKIQKSCQPLASDTSSETERKSMTDVTIIASMLATTLIAATIGVCISKSYKYYQSHYHPIGIALRKNKIDLISLSDSTVSFDYLDNGTKARTAWVGAKDAFLIYDHNENHKVDFAKELVLTKWSKIATTDFMALKYVFDSNQDNRFDANDEKFNRFQIWQDKNQDGISQAGELTPLAKAGLVRIDFDTEQTITAEFFGKEQEMQVAGVSWADGRETLAYDLALECISRHVL